ncbi:MAG TPA: cytochrome c peroxidase [Burkholderiaceae bacterium]|nr:cytochrome c peroxidase [Burkholderiaceae bacterium]
MACATCHDPSHAFGPPDGRDVRMGGPAMNRPGSRAVPTLRYLSATIPFTGHYIDDEDLHGEDGGPTGGLTWDGRADTPHEQALVPLFAPHEFANGSPGELAARVRRALYSDAFRAAFSGPGENVFDDPQQVIAWLAMALEVYQQSPSDFYPYSSKYDAYLQGETKLSVSELRGLALFNDPGKGNCASCHPSARGANGSLPRFTDAAYAALGAPRNKRLAVNRDPAYYDLGLCANGRAGLADSEDNCGRFKTPTLRNVALRKVFFHNGVFHSLQQVVEFYAQRDINPARWYPRDAAGRARKYDDLPEIYQTNVVTTPPFGGRPGDAPPLSASEVRDIVAFLGTLTDGWKPRPGGSD